jgi:hypothetical protein
MPKATRRKTRPIVAAVVQPVAKRLARMEALLLEIRHEQDVKLKRIKALEQRVDTLTDMLQPGKLAPVGS